jgi:hypothetical protein
MKVYIDGIEKGYNVESIFLKTTPVNPPITPPVVPPVTPPVVPPVTPEGYKEWGVEFQAQVGAGVSVAYQYKLARENCIAIMVQVSAASSESLATYSFTLPDGRVYPALFEMNDRLEGMLSTATLYLRSSANPAGGNITGQYLPVGDYILQLNAINGSVLNVRASAFLVRP